MGGEAAYASVVIGEEPGATVLEEEGKPEIAEGGGGGGGGEGEAEE